ncbi:Zinc finger RING/FYVE/PHD-type protein [Dioscorea alata]|nr:Zinc finger RING/FYVE/PHD-type protein [Dioscorea alata]KAH7659930.1 Zinc finger RING/FYVE/PHD-type protein [Dioscorea alata]KAH7659931.1 Zinc finger RING/FYVE/PHD-type protein [Dioscorea alata]
MAGHGHDVQTSVEVFVTDHHANVSVCINPHQLLENNMIPQPEQSESVCVPSLTSGETNMSTLNVSETGSAGMGLQQSHAPISNEIEVVINTESLLEQGDEQDVEMGDNEATRGSHKRKTTEQEHGQSSESETQFVQSSQTLVPVSADDSSLIIMFDSSNVSDDTLEEEPPNQRLRIEAENLPFDAIPTDNVAGDSENEMLNSMIGIHHTDQEDHSAIVASDQTLEAPPMDLDAANINLNGRSRLSVASFLPQSISALILPEAFAATIEDLINSIPAEDLQAASSEIALMVNQQSEGSSEDANGNNAANLIVGLQNEGLTNESSIIPSDRTGITETGVAIGSRQSTSHLNHHQVRLLKLIHRYLLPYVHAQRGHTPSNAQSEAPGSFSSLSNQNQMNQIERDQRSSSHSNVDPQPLYGLAGFLEQDSDDDEETDFPPLMQTSWQGRARGAYGISELQFLFGQDYVRRRGSYRSESSRYYDRHRDMRLDVDNMSYEELLALEERIGVVSTGLNEQEKSKCMKLWTFACAPSPEKEPEPCCICQEEFVDGAEMGSLMCGHNFHVECIKKWLDDKKICPYCRESAVDEKSQP